MNTSTVLPGIHVAAFYQTNRFFIEQVSGFVSDGLQADERVIVLATLPIGTRSLLASRRGALLTDARQARVA